MKNIFLGYNKVIDLLMEKGYKSQLHSKTIGFRTPLCWAVRMRKDQQKKISRNKQGEISNGFCLF